MIENDMRMVGVCEDDMEDWAKWNLRKKIIFSS